MTQYSLQFKPQIDFAEESYIPTDSNKDALDWINKWPNWGKGIYNNIAYLFGEKSSGKTHLAKIWQAKSGAVFVTNRLLQGQLYFDDETNGYILEDMENFAEQEKLLFNFLNYIINSKKFLLITSNSAPSKIEFHLPDLKSRINSFLAIKIKKPDENMIGQILLKYFADRQISVSSNVINYLIHRIDRSYKNISDVAEKLDKVSLLQHRKISIAMIKSVLDI